MKEPYMIWIFLKLWRISAISLNLDYLFLQFLRIRIIFFSEFAKFKEGVNPNMEKELIFFYMEKEFN